MSCAILTVEGQKWFICGEGIVKCDLCGEMSEILCDYPIGTGKRCDLNLCDLCATQIGEDFHLCPIHITEYRNKAGNAFINNKKFKPVQYGDLKIVKK